MVLGQAQMRLVNHVLQELREAAGVRLIALVSTSGQPITACSEQEPADLQSLASLTAGSFAATRQLARILDEREFTLLFHEGKHVSLHVAQVTPKVLMVMAFGSETQLGKVRLYASRATAALAELLSVPYQTDEDPAVDETYKVEAAKAIEELFENQE